MFLKGDKSTMNIRHHKRRIMASNNELSEQKKIKIGKLTEFYQFLSAQVIITYMVKTNRSELNRRAHKTNIKVNIKNRVCVSWLFFKYLFLWLFSLSAIELSQISLNQHTSLSKASRLIF
jgi:hypothetical protein